jgi:hypothetical protein
MTFARRAVLRLDPASFELIWAIWCVIVSINLIASVHVFRTALSMHILAEVGLPAWVWGSAMLVNAAALLAIVIFKVGVLAMPVILLSVPFWIFIGATMTFSDWQHGLVSPVGVFSLFGGLKFILASAQIGKRGRG